MFTRYLFSKSRPSTAERFKFTPIATSKKALRLWDRKPSAPFVPRSKSHKVWKRFLASVTGDISIDESMPGSQNRYYNSFAGINRSEKLKALRGVKRLRVVGGADDDNDFRPGHSFFETKWDMDTLVRKRK